MSTGPLPGGLIPGQLWAACKAKRERGDDFAGVGGRKLVVGVGHQTTIAYAPASRPIVPSMLDSSTNKRRSPRRRQYRRARFIFDDGSALDVTLWDLSAVGACVTSDGLGCLPRAFELQILEADGVRIVSTRRARLVWTDGRTAGLEFIK